MTITLNHPSNESGSDPDVPADVVYSRADRRPVLVFNERPEPEAPQASWGPNLTTFSAAGREPATTEAATEESTLNGSLNGTAGALGGDVCNDFSFPYLDLTQSDPVRHAFVVIYVLVIVLSVAGNWMVIWTVIRNKHMRTVTNYYIVNLAVSDFLVAMFVMPLKLLEYTAPCAWHIFNEDAMCSFMAFVLPVFVFASVLTLVAISIERYCATGESFASLGYHFRLGITTISRIIREVSSAICSTMKDEQVRLPSSPEEWRLVAANFRYYAIVYPLSAMKVHSKSRTRKILACTWIVPIIVASPYLFCKSYPFVIFSDLGSISRQICTDRFDEIDVALYGESARASGHFRKGFFFFLFIVIYLVPLMVILGTCVRIAMRLLNPIVEKQESVQGQRITRKREENKRRVARMIIVVAVAFIVAWSPFYLVTFISQVQTESFLRKSNYIFVMLAMHLVGFINSCVNPFIYNFMSDKFRKSFAQIVLSMCFVCARAPCARRLYQPRRDRAFSQRCTSAYDQDGESGCDFGRGERTTHSPNHSDDIDCHLGARGALNNDSVGTPNTTIIRLAALNSDGRVTSEGMDATNAVQRLGDESPDLPLGARRAHKRNDIGRLPNGVATDCMVTDETSLTRYILHDRRRGEAALVPERWDRNTDLDMPASFYDAPTTKLINHSHSSDT